MLRFHLPPNFIAAVARNAVPVRVEIDLNGPPPPELLPALALLQRWCGPKPPAFLQLSRAQLRDLVAAVGQQPVFIENGQPTPFRHGALLEEAPQPLDASASSSIVNRNSKIVNRSSAPPLSLDGSEHFLSIMLPSREHPRYADALALVKENGFGLEPSNRKWWLRDRHKTLNFLATHLARLRESFDAELTPNFEKNTAHLRPAEITAEVTEAGATDFSIALGVRAGSADEAMLRSAVATNRGYLEADGKIFLLDAARLEKLAIAQRALAGDPTAALAPRRAQRVSAARAAEAQDILEELSPNFQAPESWRTRSTALRNLSTLAPAPLPPIFETQLRPYQRLGVAWLWHLYRHNLAGLLADEMGLGKTLQALGLLSAVSGQRSAVSSEGSAVARVVPHAASSEKPSANDRRPKRSPSLQNSTRSPEIARPTSDTLNSQPSSLNFPRASLVVAPASLLENWRREAARFAPQLRVFVHHADRRLASADDFSAYDLVITSYGTLARDQLVFAAIEFACVIADEAQHIKNRRSQNAAALRALRARSRFLLTGTPLENSLEDLRSLFEFLLPGYLQKVPPGLRGEERAWFDDRLRAQTAPYILRRTKQAVAPELPEKLEQIIWCELTPAQAKLYRDTQERSERELFDLEAGGASEAKLKFAALTQLLRLRQICCDPRLVGEKRSAVSDQPSASEVGRVGSGAPSGSQLSDRSQVSDDSQLNFADSAKLDAFNELMAEAVDDGHRVLVFSQFTSLLALLRADLDAQQLGYCYLDGSMPARARQAEVDRFQSTPDIPLFLLSLKAGGTGLNLTGADTVVHFDPWWNPAAEAQATDRAHRIGQKKVVTSYKLIASGTVEEKVLALQAEKRALLAGVFEASDAVSAQLSLGELKSLLQVEPTLQSKQPPTRPYASPACSMPEIDD